MGPPNAQIAMEMAADKTTEPVTRVWGQDVRKFEEAQATKRVGIAAERDVALTNIRAKQELLQDNSIAHSMSEPTTSLRVARGGGVVSVPIPALDARAPFPPEGAGGWMEERTHDSPEDGFKRYCYLVQL